MSGAMPLEILRLLRWRYQFSVRNREANQAPRGQSHITGPVLVGDFCALIQRSEVHFSRSFKRTFGESPHGFVVRRRLELAAQYMLTTDAALSDLALRCGFTDQAHLCKHFRQATGQTPAAWRRAHSACHDENGTPPTAPVQFAYRPHWGNRYSPRPA
jgi:AraC-like DNA-binding protein